MPYTEDDYRQSVVFNRRSIRRFKPDKLDDWQIKAILEAAMCTPTACNQMPFELIVIKDRNVLDELQKALPLARLKTVPVAFVVTSIREWKMRLHPSSPFLHQDLAAVSLQICIAATEIGLGSCWCGVNPVTRFEEAVRKVLDVPQDVMVLSVIPVGYPDETKESNSKWFPGKVHYDKF